MLSNGKIYGAQYMFCKSWVPWPGELCHSTALGQQIVAVVTVSRKPNASCISRDRRAQKCFSGTISCYLEAIPTSEFHNVEKLKETWPWFQSIVRPSGERFTYVSHGSCSKLGYHHPWDKSLSSDKCELNQLHYPMDSDLSSG